MGLYYTLRRHLSSKRQVFQLHRHATVGLQRDMRQATRAKEAQPGLQQALAHARTLEKMHIVCPVEQPHLLRIVLRRVLAFSCA